MNALKTETKESDPCEGTCVKVTTPATQPRHRPLKTRKGRLEVGSRLEHVFRWQILTKPRIKELMQPRWILHSKSIHACTDFFERQKQIHTRIIIHEQLEKNQTCFQQAAYSVGQTNQQRAQHQELANYDDWRTCPSCVGSTVNNEPVGTSFPIYFSKVTAKKVKFRVTQLALIRRKHTFLS